jgi:hypothetical protein
MDREAMKQPEALRLADALDDESTQGRISNYNGRKAAVELRRLHEVNQDLLKALHEALETEQEPVAWIIDGGKGELWWHRSSKFDEEGNLIGPNPDDIPLYTSPPKREWVGLTLNEAEDFYDKYADKAELINAVDKFLEEKNRG